MDELPGARVAGGARRRVAGVGEGGAGVARQAHHVGRRVAADAPVRSKMEA